MNNQLYHHGVKGMKWGVRKKSSTSAKTSGKKIKSNNQTDETLAAKKDKRKKTLTFVGMTAASAVITGIGLYSLRSPKIRGAIYKGMSTFDKVKEDPNAGKLFNTKTGQYMDGDISDYFDWVVNPDGSTTFTRKPGVEF